MQDLTPSGLTKEPVLVVPCVVHRLRLRYRRRGTAHETPGAGPRTPVYPYSPTNRSSPEVRSRGPPGTVACFLLAQADTLRASSSCLTLVYFWGFPARVLV